MTPVHMRLPTGDCHIAAIATATGQTYEAIASACGFTLLMDGRPDTNHWPLPRDGDPDRIIELLCQRLTAAGMPFAPLCFGEDSAVPFCEQTRMFKAMFLHNPTDAVLIIQSDHPDDNGHSHAVALVNRAIVDCRPSDLSSNIEDLGEVYSAMVPA